MEALSDQERFDLRNRQINLFAKHKPLLEKILMANSNNEPINVVILSNKLHKHKQQISLVIKKLVENKLLEKKTDRKWQQKGGKSYFLYLTEESKLLLKQSKEILSPQTKILFHSESIDFYVNEFISSNNNNVRDQAIFRISEELDNFRGLNIEWPTNDKMINLIKEILKNFNNYDINILSRTFEIIKKLIDQGLVDKEISENLYELVVKYPMENKNSIINQTLEIFYRLIETYPDSENGYNKFILILESLIITYKDKLYFISNNRNKFGQLPDNIKLKMEKDLFRLLGNVEDNINMKSNITDIINGLHEKYRW